MLADPFRGNLALRNLWLTETQRSMDSADQTEVWTGPQLAAQLAALHGAVPSPACHVVMRVSRLPDGSEPTVYEIPDEARPLDAAAWPRWLSRRDLLAGEQLRVALLVVRETLDATGRLAECSLERRLGAADGPFHGDPARVDFVGPARMVRAYRRSRNGQLVQVAPSPQVMPPAPRGAEPFTGEVTALERHFGTGLRVIDAREPTLFEEMAGLGSVVCIRLPNGEELACGVGWHGTTPFVLVADFPRFDVPLALPPSDEAGVPEVLRRLDLVRRETRLDDKGLAVVARRRGQQALFLLRSADGHITAEPYEPASAQLGSPDQQGWLRYAEVHEKLILLDLYADGRSGDLIVLTGDAGGHVWRHLVDPDGVELWRRPSDDTAFGDVHRDRLAPGTLLCLEGAPAQRAAAGEEAPDPGPLASESLLAAVRAFEAATTALHAARDAAPAGKSRQERAELSQHLHALAASLEILSAEHSAVQAWALAEETTHAVDAERLVRSLSRLEATMLDELAQIRVVPLRSGEWRRLGAAAPFGAAVEARFPGCAYDIEEAVHCLAFRRPSAAVFHCMKVVERGLAAAGRRLELAGFPGTVRGWGAILATMRSACPADLQPVVAQLQRIRQRWHGPGLDPADKYTEAEAEQVLQSVDAFMRALAERCDEAGTPAGTEASANEGYPGPR